MHSILVWPVGMTCPCSWWGESWGAAYIVCWCVCRMPCFHAVRTQAALDPLSHNNPWKLHGSARQRGRSSYSS
jgi:hypothetical protein